MIGLDTNVLVRYLTQDDARQSKQASAFIEQAVRSDKTLWISLITLCETVWVLERSYKLPKNEMLYILQELLQTPEIMVENDEVVWLAVRDFELHETVGFADCLIGRQNIFKGCSHTITFDKAAAKKLPGVYKTVT